jgi:hypothetical protein
MSASITSKRAGTKKDGPNAFTHSKNEVTGFARAVRMGDVAGLRAAADWFRDRGQAENGRLLDVLSFEIEAECVKARQVRHVLDTMPVPKGTRKVSTVRVKAFLEATGLPVLLRGSKSEFVLVVPNDGQHTDTEERLVSLLGAAFPHAEFLVVLDNYPTTDAGAEATRLLYVFHPVAC